ncbi:radical SAM/SPASM domain-containing protein [Niallia sp. 03091]|uniref:radical SAM/SPASM domain-containing protein n=1 Tax=unclassified Niallia TaxID=2837522 RepID=UPI00404432B3
MYYYLKNGSRIKKYNNSEYYFCYNDKNTLLIQRVNQSAYDTLTLCNGENSEEDICTYLENLHGKVNEIEVIEFLKQLVSLELLDFSEIPNRCKGEVFDGKEFYSPFIATLELTRRCPLKCQHCYINAGDGPSMSRTELHSILGELKKIGVNIIQLTGGEPLFYKHILELLDLLTHEYDFGVEITTSGSYFNTAIIEKLNLLNKNRKLSIQVSIDGLEETHNSIRGRTKAFQKALEFVTQVVDKNIKTTVASCLIEQKKSEIELLCDLLFKKGVNKYRLGLLNEQGRASSNDLESKWNSVSLNKLIESLNSKHNNFVVLQDEIDISTESKKNCGAGYKIFKIDAIGDVYPCAPHLLKMGNIYDQSLTTILGTIGRQFAKLSSPNQNSCEKCENKQICEGCSARTMVQKNKVQECWWYNEIKNSIV